MTTSIEEVRAAGRRAGAALPPLTRDESVRIALLLASAQRPAPLPVPA